MLAQSARRGGYPAISLDWFADTDTRANSLRCQRVPPQGDQHDAEALLRAARRLAPPDGCTALVYGSGFECQPELLAELAAGRPLLGNAPEVLRLVKAPREFFPVLDALRIPYPEIRTDPPDGEPDAWLIKSGCGEGGKGVAFSRLAQQAESGGYYQRYVRAAAHSALFLAAGGEAAIVGFNTQWTSAHDPARPFLFAGACSAANLDPTQRGELLEYVRRLTRAFSLRGLNSLDFVLDGGFCRVLEINPRPSATLSLYDADFRTGLLARHVAACRGRPLGRLAAPRRVRGFRIVYARRRTRVPERFAWPSWCADRPAPETEIAPGEPICTVYAAASDPSRVDRRVTERARRIETLLSS